MESFGSRVKEARKALKLTVAELAEAVGISDRFLQDIEAGKRNTSNDILVKLAFSLCVTTDYLMTGKKEQGVTISLDGLLLDLTPSEAELVEESIRLTVRALRHNK